MGEIPLNLPNHNLFPPTQWMFRQGFRRTCSGIPQQAQELPPPPVLHLSCIPDELMDSHVFSPAKMGWLAHTLKEMDGGNIDIQETPFIGRVNAWLIHLQVEGCRLPIAAEVASFPPADTCQGFRWFLAMIGTRKIRKWVLQWSDSSEIVEVPSGSETLLEKSTLIID